MILNNDTIHYLTGAFMALVGAVSDMGHDYLYKDKYSSLERLTQEGTCADIGIENGIAYTVNENGGDAAITITTHFDYVRRDILPNLFGDGCAEKKEMIPDTFLVQPYIDFFDYYGPQYERQFHDIVRDFERRNERNPSP